MKSIKLLLVVTFALFTIQAFGQKTTLEKASEAYRNNDFKKSIELYEQVVAQALSENKESAEVYYNLGNSYFRNGQTAKAILNYERALLINPSDKDIRHNLRFARTRIEDKIDTTDALFLTNWMNGLKNLFSSNTWSVVAIVLFILFLGCVSLYLFVQKIWMRKVSFYSGIVLIPLILAANTFAFSQKNDRLHRNTGIILSPSTSIMTSPDANSKELFRLHEGTKVRLNKTDANWYEIEIANGSVGWISKENLEII